MTANAIEVLQLDEIEAVRGGLGRGVSAAGGVAGGVYEGTEVAGALAEGLFGAEIGAWAGPIGVAAGAVAGVGIYYALRRLN